MPSNMRKLALALPCLSLAVLIFAYTAPQLLAKKKVTAADPGMNEHKRAVQALNRLTFGPRPGDVQQVMAMGVDRWIDLQLHPEKNPDSAIESRLAAFRTLHMSSKEIAEEFPDNQMVKQVMDGKRSMPSDPAKRAIYQVQIARLQEKQEKKKEKNDLKAESAPVPATSIPATPIPDTQVPAAQVPAAPQASDSAKTAEELAAAASADAANSAPNNLADTNSNSMGANSMSENAMLASTGDATASAGVPHVSPPSRDMGTPTNEMATTLEMKPPSTADARRRENHERENHERENHERENHERENREEDRLYANLKIQELINLPPDQRYKKVLALSADEQVAFADSLRGGKGKARIEDFLVGMAPRQKETLLAMNNPQGLVADELVQAKLLRAIYSDRQLEEVMTDFWFNHFNVIPAKAPSASS